MKEPKHIVSFMIPIASILIVIGFVFFKPNITGASVVEQTDNRIIDADITLKTTPNEIIPLHSIIRVSIDTVSGTVPLTQFIEKTGKKFEIVEGALGKINYSGNGYSGNYTYTLTLKDFPLNTTIKNGTHTLINEIVFKDSVLYKNEKQVYIS